MRRSTRGSLVALAVTGTLVLGVAVVPGAAAPSRDIREVEAQVMDLEMKAASATERYNEAQLKLQDTQARLDTVKSRVQRERDALAAARASVNDLARGVYMSGGMDTTLQVLLAEDPTDFLAQSAALDQVAEPRVDLRPGRRAREHGVGDAVDRGGLGRDRPTRAHEGVEQNGAGAVDHGELDDLGVVAEARRFRVENDFPHY